MEVERAVLLSEIEWLELSLLKTQKALNTFLNRREPVPASNTGTLTSFLNSFGSKAIDLASLIPEVKIRLELVDNNEGQDSVDQHTTTMVGYGDHRKHIHHHHDYPQGGSGRYAERMFDESQWMGQSRERSTPAKRSGREKFIPEPQGTGCVTTFSLKRNLLNNIPTPTSSITEGVHNGEMSTNEQIWDKLGPLFSDYKPRLNLSAKPFFPNSENAKQKSKIDFYKKIVESIDERRNDGLAGLTGSKNSMPNTVTEEKVRIKYSRDRLLEISNNMAPICLPETEILTELAKNTDWIQIVKKNVKPMKIKR